jgi:hypothetical protein
MQPLKDPDLVTLVLQRETLEELSLEDMRQEFRKLKRTPTIKRAFLNCLMKETREACMITYFKTWHQSYSTRTKFEFLMAREVFCL